MPRVNVRVINDRHAAAEDRRFEFQVSIRALDVEHVTRQPPTPETRPVVGPTANGALGEDDSVAPPSRGDAP